MEVEKNTLFNIIRNRIMSEYPKQFKRLSQETGIHEMTLRRIVNNPEISPTLTTIQPLIEHFKIKVLDSKVRKGKTLN